MACNRKGLQVKQVIEILNMLLCSLHDKSNDLGFVTSDDSASAHPDQFLHYSLEES